MTDAKQTFINVRKAVSDMEALSALLASSARELAQFANAVEKMAGTIERLAPIFTGGGIAAQATPFEDPGAVRERSSPPRKRPTYQEKLKRRVLPAEANLIRELWFGQPPENRNVDLRRRIAERIDRHMTVVNKIIATTPESDSNDFSKRPGQNSSETASTSSTASPTGSGS